MTETPDPSGPDFDGGPIMSAGGFCAPKEVVYDGIALHGTISFPEISVAKFVPKWFEPPTPAEARAQEAYRSLVNRVVDRQVQARDHAIELAVMDAFVNDWDVHVHEPPVPFNMYRSDQDNALHTLGFVGIAFTPARYPVPTITYHREHLDEFDWED
jgi:hypothetical protein